MFYLVSLFFFIVCGNKVTPDVLFFFFLLLFYIFCYFSTLKFFCFRFYATLGPVQRSCYTIDRAGSSPRGICHEVAFHRVHGPSREEDGGSHG